MPPGTRQGFKFFIRGLVIFKRINFSKFAFGIFFGRRKSAGSMIVEIFIKRAEIKFVKITSKFLVDESITNPFADDGTIFSFDQSVVVGMAGTRLGELNQ